MSSSAKRENDNRITRSWNITRMRTRTFSSNTGTNNRSTVTHFQNSLFPVFQQILALQITEFMPYVFQIMAQLLHLEPNGITTPFRKMFEMLLHPAQYELRGNVPALVELLKAYLSKPGNGPSSTLGVVVPHLQAVLGVWQKLCCSKSTEVHALNMLEVIVSRVPLKAYVNGVLRVVNRSKSFIEYSHRYAPMLGQIFSILIQRLLKVKGMRFKYIFIPSFLFIIGKIGGSPVVTSVESLKSGMFATLLSQVILPNVGQIPGQQDRKKCLVGLCYLAAKTEQMRMPAFKSVAVDVVKSIASLVSSKDPHSKVKDEGDDTTAEIAYNSNSGFSRLSFATSKKSDPFPNIKTDNALITQSLMQLNQLVPGVINASGVSDALRTSGVRV